MSLSDQRAEDAVPVLAFLPWPLEHFHRKVCCVISLRPGGADTVVLSPRQLNVVTM